MTEVAPLVRRVHRRDIDAVTAIERASFPSPWPREAFEVLLDAPGFLVADEGQVVGFAVGTLEARDGQPWGHLKDLAVAPPSRSRGIGRRLCRAATDCLHRAGADVVGLEVRPSNHVALACYRAVGFSIERREPAYYDDGEDAYWCVHRRSD
ncbi:MAG: GNAT family N-acetyltransferase [Halococcoides sp.]